MGRRKYDSLLHRILSNIYTLDWQNENGCWLWRGKLDKNGYGRINVRIKGRHRTIRVHKLLWELMYGGEIPEGLTLDHMEHCIGKACCNPDHLDVVTSEMNTSLDHKRGRRKHVYESNKRRRSKRTVGLSDSAGRSEAEPDGQGVGLQPESALHD